MVFVDGFAGAGSYGSGEDDASPGSPLLIAEIANEFNSSNRSSDVQFIAVEKVESRFDELSRSLSKFPHSKVTPIHGDFSDQLDHILTMAKDHPAVFFIDPFGVKDSTLAGLKPLLHRGDTELLLVFNSSRLSKLAGFEDSDAPEARGKLRLVSRILNEDPEDLSPQWLRQYHVLGKHSARWLDWAVARYTQALVESSPFLKYGLAYPVRKKFGGFPTYHLIYATRHPAGLPVINDLLCAEEDRLFDDTWNFPSNGQMPMFATSRDDEIRQKAMQLEDEIREYGLQHQGSSRQAITQEMVIRRPAEFKVKHYREVIDQLENFGKAQYGRMGTGTGRDDKSTRPISFFRVPIQS